VNVAIISNLTRAGLYVSSVGALVVQLFVQDPPFDPKPAIALLPPISVAVTWVFHVYSKRLEKEEFSTSDALAIGYVNSLLGPVINSLVKARQPGSEKPRMVIFIPERLEETEPKYGDLLPAKIEEQNLSTKMTTIEVSEGQPRNVRAVSKGGILQAYFDFPSTIYTLKAYVEYRARKEGITSEESAALGKEYIGQFREKLLSELSDRGLLEYVSFTNKDLDFEFRPAAPQAPVRASFLGRLNRLLGRK
jgi:hypothetical protein